MSELPTRKQNRLLNYDYGKQNAYFITICAKNKQCIFSHIVGGGILDAPLVKLTSAGENIAESINYLNANTEVKVDKCIIMPNHIHLILTVSSGTSGRPSPTNAAIPKFVSSLKRYTNKKCQGDLWQRSFYDHVIRDENDYLKICNYIETNPAKWADDEYYISAQTKPTAQSM